MCISISHTQAYYLEIVQWYVFFLNQKKKLFFTYSTVILSLLYGIFFFLIECSRYGCCFSIKFNSNSHLLSSSLLHFINSHGCRINSVGQFNLILTSKCNKIQYLINKNVNVCNNFNNIFTITQLTIITQYLLTDTHKIQEH